MTTMRDGSDELLDRCHIVQLPLLDVPLVIERGYRGVEETTHSVTFRRRVACTCKLMGCRRCEFVGWIVRTETVNVRVPARIDLGTTFRLPGQGDAIVPDSPGDLAVEVVEESERANELRAAQQARETEQANAWEAARVEALRNRRHHRRAALRAIGLLSVVGVVVGGFVVKSHFDKGDIGAPCATNQDCRSAQCLIVQRALSAGETLQVGESRVPGTSLLAPIVERNICTTTCTRDTECPMTMKCGRARASSLLAPNVTHIEQTCVPR